MQRFCPPIREMSFKNHCLLCSLSHMLNIFKSVVGTSRQNNLMSFFTEPFVGYSPLLVLQESLKDPTYSVLFTLCPQSKIFFCSNFWIAFVPVLNKDRWSGRFTLFITFMMLMPIFLVLGCTNESCRLIIVFIKETCILHLHVFNNEHVS